MGKWRQIHLRDFFSNTLTLCTHHIVAQGVFGAQTLHLHVIHDVTCLSVLCLFLFCLLLLPLALIFSLTLSTCSLSCSSTAMSSEPPRIKATALRATTLRAPTLRPSLLRAEALRASTFSWFGPLRSSFLSCCSFVLFVCIFHCFYFLSFF